MKRERKRVSEVALGQCVTELRAACRRPIDPAAVDTLVGWLRPNFERVLDDPDGRQRWADHGQQLRSHGRHIGALADFFGYHANVDTVGIEQLTPAFQMISAACRVGAQGPLPVPTEMNPAETYLRSILPANPA